MTMNTNTAPTSKPLGRMLTGSEGGMLQWEMFMAAVLVLLALIQTLALVFSDHGVLAQRSAIKDIEQQENINQRWIARNAKITTELVDLHKGREIIEAHARYNYLLVRQGEDYFRLVDPTQ
jgi:cell division protein FtsB